MELMFEVISRQKFSTGFSVTHVFSEAGGFIGRSGECEWILPDKGKRISRKHAAISCDGNSFFIEDVSRNGIHIEPGRTALERGAQHKVEHGDSYTIGIYTIQARLLRRPDAYIPPRTGEDWLVTADNVLSTDPLAAMDQQEDFEAKRRLGYYDDLLGETVPGKIDAPSDHNSAATDCLPRVSMTPQSKSFDLPEDWDSDDNELLFPEAGPLEAIPSPPISGERPAFEAEERLQVSEMEAFFKALGYSRAPDSSEERERIFCQAAEIVIAAVDGLHHCLRNQAECKNDLRLPVTTMRLAGNNPLKFTPTPGVALEQLLGPAREGMMPAGEAMRAGFSDLHGHHLGILTGARASIRAVLEKISPAAIEVRLDGNGTANFLRTARLWHLFRKTHQALLDDHEGFAAFFLHDFARAYELQARTLGALPGRSAFKGDS